MIALLLLLACAPDEADRADVDTAYEEERIRCDERDPALSWENFGEGFVTRYCTSCHGADVPEADRNDAPDGVDFDSLEDVVAWASRIEARAVDFADMPPGGGPGPEERHRLAEWLECDVKNR
jgi:uncharacterized membrane protein